MNDYPRDLLISEEVIREFEELVGVRFINKTECAQALADRETKLKADLIDEMISRAKKHSIYGYSIALADLEDIGKRMKEQNE